MATNRTTSTTLEVLVQPDSNLRVTTIALEVLMTVKKRNRRVLIEVQA